MAEKQPNNDPGQGNNDGQNPNAEAAKYRTRLRDAEAQRDSLQADLDARDRAAIERLARHHLAVPSDLFDLGNVDMADMLTEDGQVDPEAVEQAAATMLEQRPGLAATPLAQRLADAYKDQMGTRVNDGQVEAVQQRLEAVAEYLDPAAFLNDDGGIDGDRLERFIQATKPSPVDVGQGQRHFNRQQSGSAWNRLVKGR